MYETENKLTDQIQEIRQENEFNEIDLNQFKIKLIQLTNELTTPPNILVRQESTSFINNISVIVSSEQLNCFTNFNVNTEWIQHGITVAGGNKEGNNLNQLCYPQGICMDDDHTIYIANLKYNRIVEWKCDGKNGRIISSENGLNILADRLDCPSDVIIDKLIDSLIISDRSNRQIVLWPRQNDKNEQIIISNIDCWGMALDKKGYLYVCDIENHQVRRWRIGDSRGTIVAGGNGKGGRLDQLDEPSFIFVDDDYSVYVSDYNNHRVMKWMKDAKEGIIVAGGEGPGNSLTQLSDPHGVIVDQLGQIYVADYMNNRVMRWREGATQGTIVVGRYGRGDQSYQLNGPTDLSFDGQGNLYVVDQLNHRVQKFEIDSS